MKAGEKYRIKAWTKRPNHWNMLGGMDKWQGQIVTISRVINNNVYIKEDAREGMLSGGWTWAHSDFEDINTVSDPNTAFLMAKRR
jgi:hypothetical protein